MCENKMSLLATINGKNFLVLLRENPIFFHVISQSLGGS